MLTESLCIQEKVKFPAQPQPNPSTQCNVSCPKEIQKEDVNSITTLRSGKVIDKSIHFKDQEPSLDLQSNGEVDGKPKSSDNLDKEKGESSAPFPQRLQPIRNLNQNAKILDIFK